MEQLIKYLDSIARLEDDNRQYLESVIKTTRPKKKQVLVNLGAVAKHISFIEKGVVRGYRYSRGKEKTNWILGENNIFISVRSFLTQKPSEDARWADCLRKNSICKAYVGRILLCAIG